MRFLKFCIVGFSGIFINLVTLFILKEFFGLLLIASLIAIELSILTNFLLNDAWTFKDRRRKGKRNFLFRLIKWNFARGSISLVVNWGLFILLTSIGIHYLIAQVIGIILATLIAYITSMVWIWK